MKNIYLLISAFLLLPSFCSAGDKYELGIIIGEPTGLSAKQNLGGNKALDAAAAWSFSGEKSLSLHSDYLWFRNDVFKVEKGRLPLYYGVGARLKLQDRSVIGARFPIGLQYFFRAERFTVFLEMAPVLDLLPDTDFGLSAAIGFRVLL